MNLRVSNNKKSKKRILYNTKRNTRKRNSLNNSKRNSLKTRKKSRSNNVNIIHTNTRKRRKLRSYRKQRKRSSCKPLCKKNKKIPGYDCGECILAESRNQCKVVNKFSINTGRFEQYCRPLKNTKHDI